MAILTFPTITPEIQSFGIRYNTQVSTSTIAGLAQTVELPGARWKGSMSFRDLTVADAANLKAFLLELRGSSGIFFYGDITHTTPFNVVTGSPTISATASTPRFIRVTLGASSPTFSPGDYVQLGTDDQRELKMVISSTVVSGDTYDLIIEPMIRRIDFIGLSVIYTDPKGVFFLTADDQGTWASRTKVHLTDMSMDFVEVFQ
jgi:hypothetical protein